MADERTYESRAQRVFTEIHDKNAWKGTSVSGPGSALQTTALLREQLEPLFAELNLRTLSDAPCGDANWITAITGTLDYYFGFDIVESLIAENLKRVPKTNHFFRFADVTRDILPRTDAILCRDCLVHLPLDVAIQAIENFKRSGSTYLLATTFPTVEENGPSGFGGWRPLNLTVSPFNLPPPRHTLRERAPNPADRYNDKMLGVWLISDL